MVYVGALWGQFGWVFSPFGGGKQFWGNFGWLSPIYRSNLESNLAFFPYLGGNLGQFGGKIGWSPPEMGGNFGGYFDWSFPEVGADLGQFGGNLAGFSPV